MAFLPVEPWAITSTSSWERSQISAPRRYLYPIPHGGTGTRIWREAVALGADVAALAELRGAHVSCDTALLWDWESWWALEQVFRPSVDLDFKERQLAYYEQLWRAHVPIDFAHPAADLPGYRLVVVPQMYLCREQWAKNLRDYVTDGGTLVVSYFSGIVDEDDAVHLGGHPGVLRDLLGLTVGEFLPLRQGERVRLDSAGPDAHGTVWSEEIELRGAEPVHRFTSGPAAGGAAVTRNRVEGGTVWYVATSPDAGTLREILRAAAAGAGSRSTPRPRTPWNWWSVSRPTARGICSRSTTARTRCPFRPWAPTCSPAITTRAARRCRPAPSRCCASVADLGVDLDPWGRRTVVLPGTRPARGSRP